MRFVAIGSMLVLAAAAAALALTGRAGASHVEARLTVPDEATVGQPSEIKATLLFADDGTPVAEAPVTFYLAAAFGGVAAEMELGRTLTNSDGVATLEYEPRVAGEHAVRMEYAAGEEGEVESVATSINVAGGAQLYRSASGVTIPGLNVWLLIALVAAVWAILLTVALRVIAIAHAGGGGPGAGGASGTV